MAFDIRFGEVKNQILKSTKGVSFEDVRDAIEDGNLLADIAHANLKRSKQRMYVVKINDYVYIIPYIINLEKKDLFLKTAYPSRKYTKLYKEGEK